MGAIRCVAACIGLTLCADASASANPIVLELEANGTATNNTAATAQFLAGSSFGLPVGPNVMVPWYGALPTVTIQGRGGMGNLGVNWGDGDFDFYRFRGGGSLLIDLDDVFDPFFPPAIALFNSTGQLLAWSTQNSPAEPGSTVWRPGNQYDPFIGEYLLPSFDDYYIALSWPPFVGYFVG